MIDIFSHIEVINTIIIMFMLAIILITGETYMYIYSLYTYKQDRLDERKDYINGNSTYKFQIKELNKDNSMLLVKNKQLEKDVEYWHSRFDEIAEEKCSGKI